MSRVLAVFPVDLRRPATRGLVEKAGGLVRAAAAAGHEVTAALTDGAAASFRSPDDWPDHPSVGVDSRRRETRAALYRFRGFWTALAGHLRTVRYDAVWVRAHPISGTQRRFLASACGRGARVLYDIPTYPSSRERRGVLHRIAAASTSPLAEVAPAVDRFVTLSPDERIEGVPTIRVRNGVCVPPTPRRVAPATGPLRLLGLGQWADYHGLDRLFYAAAQRPERFRFRIAGEGPSVAAYARLAKRLALDVTWCPPAFGPARAALLSWADAGLGCLAIHRKGVYPDQALKHRVYAAAGLPFVCTVADPQWAGVEGVWRLPADESAVTGADFATAVEGFRQNARPLRDALREAARDVAWGRAYAPLFTYLHHHR